MSERKREREKGERGKKRQNNKNKIIKTINKSKESMFVCHLMQLYAISRQQQNKIYLFIAIYKKISMRNVCTDNEEKKLIRQKTVQNKTQRLGYYHEHSSN